jgi:predicted Ser/Thr protein kinase
MTTQPPSQIGRYRIERELGRGTMGVVYEAQDTTLGRIVALKTFGAMAVIAAHEREAFEQRFLSEARISATLDDENVVGVYDVGRDFQTGLLYMALEYVRGETLADALSRGPMPWQEAARIIAKVARALQAAHAHHIVHRDIKPANIMLTHAGQPKIMDFGIAKASASQLTVAGQVFGTPAYMSPEQASGEEVDGRSDIFSLGCVFYELITKTRPFEGNTMAATLTRILREEPRPASSIVKVPRSIDAIIARALRKGRETRYESAAHFAGDLERAIAGETPTHATQLAPLDTLDLGKVARASELPKRPTQAPRIVISRPADDAVADGDESAKKRRLILIGAAAVSVMAIAGFVLTKGNAPGKGEPQAAAPQASPSASAPVPATAPTSLPSTPAPPPAGAGPAATPAAAVLSVGGGQTGSARLSLDLRYPFASASLRVKLDDRVIFVNSLHGMPIRNAGVTTGYDGRYATDFTIPAGSHVIQVEVRSGDNTFIESSPLRLNAGENRRLWAVVDKTITLRVE